MRRRDVTHFTETGQVFACRLYVRDRRVPLVVFDSVSTTKDRVGGVALSLRPTAFWTPSPNYVILPLCLKGCLTGSSPRLEPVGRSVCVERPGRGRLEAGPPDGRLRVAGRRAVDASRRFERGRRRSRNRAPERGRWRRRNVHPRRRARARKSAKAHEVVRGLDM